MNCKQRLFSILSNWLINATYRSIVAAKYSGFLKHNFPKQGLPLTSVLTTFSLLMNNDRIIRINGKTSLVLCSQLKSFAFDFYPPNCKIKFKLLTSQTRFDDRC